jgi:ADP-ribosylglycohydrolase/protein-tyrosine phosphatase
MTKLNSDNAPLRIDFLPAHVTGLPGRIGMTIAPGKRIKGIHGNWDRDLVKDLTRVREVYGIDLLVCLVEDFELDQLHITELPELAVRMGLEVIRHPIPDCGVPSDEGRLHQTVTKVLTAAEAGRSVMIHCRGGLGRAGLIAGCCLVALGVGADDAMAIVREARRHTIETRVQEEAIRAYDRGGYRFTRCSQRKCRSVGRAPVSGAAGGFQEPPPFDRFLGCLIGGAVGDALGCPVEFTGPGKAILARYGEQPPARLDYAGDRSAVISDDTQMTLFVAEGIIRAVQRHNDRGLCSVPGVLGRALLRWYDTQTTTLASMGASGKELPRNGWLRTEERLYARRAPGNTCMSSLSKLMKNEWDGTKPNDSKGCGAVMRSAPIGLGAGSRETAFEVACASGAQTHGHPLGYLPAGYLASLVHDLARGMRLREALDCADALLGREAQQGVAPTNAPEEEHRQGARELLSWIARAKRAAESWKHEGPVRVIERLGEGWVGEEALAISICCALAIEDGGPEDVARVLWASVAHRGDSDSTGAISGNILGAMLGVGALPKRWMERVELVDIVERLAGDLYAITVLERELDRGCYPPN